MAECVAVAGADSAIAREVAHTCAAVGAHHSHTELFLSSSQPHGALHSHTELFLADGGMELLNTLARSRSAAVQVECALAIGA